MLFSHENLCPHSTFKPYHKAWCSSVIKTLPINPWLAQTEQKLQMICQPISLLQTHTWSLSFRTIHPGVYSFQQHILFPSPSLFNNDQGMSSEWNLKKKQYMENEKVRAGLSPWVAVAQILAAYSASLSTPLPLPLTSVSCKIAHF